MLYWVENESFKKKLTALAVAESKKETYCRWIHYKKQRALPRSFKSYLKSKKEWEQWLSGNHKDTLAGVQRLSAFNNAKDVLRLERQTLNDYRRRLWSVIADIATIKGDKV